MGNQGGNYLRELIRILVRDLGILEKSDAAFSGTTISQCHAIVEIGRVNANTNAARANASERESTNVNTNASVNAIPKAKARSNAGAGASASASANANKISLNELADLLGLDKSTMSRTINNLVNDNLVFREIHPEDRRYVTLALTEMGQKVFANIESSMGLYYKNIFQSIPEAKRDQVLESLELLTNAIKENKSC